MSGPGLEEPHALLPVVLDLLPFPAFLIEPGAGRVVFANRPAREALVSPPVNPEVAADGVSATGPSGLPLDPGDWPGRRAARGERLEGEEVTWQTPAGRATFAVSTTTLPAADGHPPLALMTCMDVTRQKQTEAELRQAVRVRDDFFSFATHELKDPLSALLLSVELMQRLVARPGPLPVDALKERLEVGKRQGQRLARMIENLLEVSRIANGRLRPDVEPFDLCEVVGEVVGRFGDQAREAGTDLALEVCGPTVGYFDRVQLEHLVGNLLSNALKYGGGGPVRVRVLSDPVTAVIEVEDHGIGIAETDQQRIFERFERATDGHRQKSLGLGLYIVRSIAEAHGGTVGVRSSPGRGSTFRVALPRKRLPGGNPPPAQQD